MTISRRPPRRWSLCDSYNFIARYVHQQTRSHASRTRRAKPLALAQTRPTQLSPTCPAITRTTPPSEPNHQHALFQGAAQRGFHNYFVTHLPSNSMTPDSRSRIGPHHKLPRSAAAPHTAKPGAAPALSPPHLPSNRELTVVRIPLHSAKHHFGVTESRGSRPYNEDSHQAGTIDMPAFAKRVPISLSRSSIKKSGEGTSADSAFGDPQVFYFGVFDGHGGAECSKFLQDELHGYIEEAAAEFELKSSLRKHHGHVLPTANDVRRHSSLEALDDNDADGVAKLDAVQMRSADDVKALADIPTMNEKGAIGKFDKAQAVAGESPVPAKVSQAKALRLQKEIVDEYKKLIGGYYRRFSPKHFSVGKSEGDAETPVSIESVLTYAFLRADLDFVSAQARKPDPEDPYVSDSALNSDEILGRPHHKPPSGTGIGGQTRFKGGSTGSVALISTPSPAPFFHPSASSTLIVAHVGDTRILLCETATGLARPLTSDHHPANPMEAQRLRRYATSFITDSFGEERFQGLANSRAFGDMKSKRHGVSAEPEITRTEMGPAEYSFLVLVSDGVSGTLSDQEIVDVVKEANTPEQGSKAVVSLATEVSTEGDNATCMVIRLGGWERRSEGGLGSLGTKELRDHRRSEASDPRRGRR
ncbi:phosphatase 2C-like domain-containing protein [Microdochium trichocladiopsis]|uniref:Phosphatase 2C-like domain-containing protein n=1 Tax=Microdochium trichocladiopsis TaxID=1682393 RepID=A0A9P8YHQ9_9PEZI|nr:phosphatase 2C-like domain-containing protein [Microdochium trichocladiopsis]KAH7040222.1 phosphatase 2C-like domain-containing protein [Microdochium trichocladiopsis]